MKSNSALTPHLTFADVHPQWVIFDAHPTPYVANAGALYSPENFASTWTAQPNPFRAGTWIQSSENPSARIEITNALGQVVQTFDGAGPFYWTGDVPGMYWRLDLWESGVEVIPVHSNKL